MRATVPYGCDSPHFQFIEGEPERNTAPTSKLLQGSPGSPLKSAGDSDTNAHLCHIGGADFLLLGARWQGGVQSVREGVQLTEYLQIKPKLIHFT